MILQVRNKGTAQLDAREDAGGNMQTRFLVVEVGLNIFQLALEHSSILSD